MSQRIAVDLAKSYRLLNHGPTVMVASAHAGRRNLMSAAWADPDAFADGHWKPGQGGQPSIHYVAGGHFFETGAAFEIPDLRRSLFERKKFPQITAA
jgi:hypothetical protein